MVSVQVPSHTTFCMRKGCYKHANPLGLRLNPTRGLPTTGSRIWGPFKQTNKILLQMFTNLILAVADPFKTG